MGLGPGLGLGLGLGLRLGKGRLPVAPQRACPHGRAAARVTLPPQRHLVRVRVRVRGRVGAAVGLGAGVGLVPPQRHQLRTRVEACRESAMPHPAHRRPQLDLVGTARRRIVTLQDLVRVRVRVRVRVGQG